MILAKSKRAKIFRSALFDLALHFLTPLDMLTPVKWADEKNN